MNSKETYCSACDPSLTYLKNDISRFLILHPVKTLRPLPLLRTYGIETRLPRGVPGALTLRKTANILYRCCKTAMFAMLEKHNREP